MSNHGVGVEITGLTKRYGDVTALAGVDLTIAPGEFMTLLGPSGSGKTTTLNAIAGFVEPDSGDIRLGERPLLGVPTHQRDIGVVFQHYALFPHMKVEANVGYPLRQRGVKKHDIARRVGEMLEVVGLSHLRGRYPRELSGGQQQRVALARALVFEPKLLLLDEPLGALDRRLREGLQLEIKRLHREVGVTFVFVTHDQEEALAMSDRIAVFNDGRIEQVATASELYERPTSLFAARFLGDSNVFEGTYDAAAQPAVLCNDLKLHAPAAEHAQGDRVALVVRPEHTQVHRREHVVPTEHNMLRARVTDVVYLGGRRRLVLAGHDGEILVDEMAPSVSHAVGDEVVVSWSPERAAVVGCSGQ
ncbi:ABC transporter ATP-binding protein [Nocardioides sp. QY071]|uniref:ABC transporter ATP-binding protein n=1 Tax=Nocardioides sp. QY071 TaxID=3044187 RepID=UPI00249CA975|nr:ABC transporter ATP-binding protein [Nocardioides sp. QY071]WGY02896.1 ABC transporter ATP-binding protein [Nocardioides sp. QY071]